jgi:hypothetical protein
MFQPLIHLRMSVSSSGLSDYPSMHFSSVAWMCQGQAYKAVHSGRGSRRAKQKAACQRLIFVLEPVAGEVTADVLPMVALPRTVPAS